MGRSEKTEWSQLSPHCAAAGEVCGAAGEVCGGGGGVWCCW